MSLNLASSVRTSTQPLACPRCGNPVDVKSRHVVVAGSMIKVYCSDVCLRGIAVREEPPPPRAARSAGWWIAAGIAVGGAAAAWIYEVEADGNEIEILDPMAHRVPLPLPTVAHAIVAKPAALRAAVPTAEDEARQFDEALVRDLAHDAWIHPLAGPRRRMPQNHVQAFGAARDVDPPPECLSGHCGVDLADVNIWGEPVHAVHDGVVDWVNRGPNEEHGGIFVKIAHRDGTLFSWYFHLAAVPRWVRPGVPIKVGQVIGLVGDTGMKISAPHLHFALTVKPNKTGRERYIDPEPLCAIWPLWIPDGQTAHLSTQSPPGVPARGPDGRPRAKPQPAAPVSTPVSAPAEPAAAEAAPGGTN